MAWYKGHSRDLPWRKTKDPYSIWICEIILQQTQVAQGTNHYLNFIQRFPNVETLAAAEEDEVLLYWKGLGYYSRAINIHKAAKQIVERFNGTFPNAYDDILSLKGIGRYTAAAISSICFGIPIPAVDGNFYRVLSRLFADDFDISKSSAFNYFSDLALRIMPVNSAGDFNQAMMDLGSQICRPKKPECNNCPVNWECRAYLLGTVNEYPVKTKKAKSTALDLQYYFVHNGPYFIINQRHDGFIWKKLFEFVTEMPTDYAYDISHSKQVKHKLTHKNLTITINRVELDSLNALNSFTENFGGLVTDIDSSERMSFPKPLQDYIRTFFTKQAV